MFKAGDKVYIDVHGHIDLPGVVTDVYGKHVLVRIEARYLDFDVDAILTFHAENVRLAID